jgi:hypothetical protein
MRMAESMDSTRGIGQAAEMKEFATSEEHGIPLKLAFEEISGFQIAELRIYYQNRIL